MIRPPRSGWTIVFFALVLFIIVAAAFDYITGAQLVIALAVLLGAYFGYQRLVKH